MHKRILIAGAGAFGREVEGWLRAAGESSSGYIDDEKPNVLYTIKDFVPKEGDEVLVSVADPLGREVVVEYLRERGAKFHGLWLMMKSHSAVIGGGCILCPYSVVSAGAKVGDFVHVNLGSKVGHDVVVGDYTTLSCDVDLTGNVTVGRRCFFGSGARVMPGVKIGDDCRIGAGCVVVNDIPAGTTVYAQPARVL